MVWSHNSERQGNERTRRRVPSGCSPTMVAIVQDMGDALPLRIFLASPGDLEDERAAVRACVGEHNARRDHESGVTYEVVEWDRMRGTARRAKRRSTS